MKRAQTAIEYLFMLAAALILVGIAMKTILDTSRQLETTISDYTKTVREKVLENL
ncbi:class III signal peptide-containing protein [Thermococcus waiotapuensis]|uniref:Class III signal peptide-containing protein n=1 Tax=Thermococcus waiotapuensis TaxID=90909 RepID=A0AAE4NXB5_9EURY|nr:class III signal peptide-containing protein [Thermococcus waiotapuensis]MDV3104417.1 class III signal peptide-containing protein [Thermococcus waiotapuensis]